MQQPFPLLSELLKAGRASRQLVELFPGPLGFPSPKMVREKIEGTFDLPPWEHVENKAIEICEHLEKSIGLR